MVMPSEHPKQSVQAVRGQRRASVSASALDPECVEQRKSLEDMYDGTRLRCQDQITVSLNVSDCRFF